MLNVRGWLDGGLPCPGDLGSRTYSAPTSVIDE